MRVSERLAIGAATACVVVVACVVGSGLYAQHRARKLAETKRFLEAKVRYAEGADRDKAQEELLKFTVATSEPPEASVALLDLIQTYPDAGKQDKRYSPERLLADLPGTPGALLYEAETLEKKGQAAAAAKLLDADRVFRSGPYPARYGQLTLLNHVLRDCARKSPPDEARELYEKALGACDTLAMETQVPSDVGMAQFFKAVTLFERAQQLHASRDADEAIRLAGQIKDIPGNRNAYLLNEGPQELIERVRKWQASQSQ